MSLHQVRRPVQLISKYLKTSGKWNYTCAEFGKSFDHCISIGVVILLHCDLGHCISIGIVTLLHCDLGHCISIGVLHCYLGHCISIGVVTLHNYPTLVVKPLH